jgi:DNA-binding transcriptional MerR regulator
MSKAAYAIGDLARHTGTKVETIRWYERDGVMPVPVRTRGGHRVYTQAHRM